MSLEQPSYEQSASWDSQLEHLMGHAAQSLEQGDFVEALETLSGFTFPDDGEAISIERVTALKRMHTMLGEHMKRAQADLQAAVGRTGNSRRAHRAYGRRR